MPPTAAPLHPLVLEASQLAVNLAGAGGARALRHVSLQLKAGEIVAVLGPPGVGKSALLRVLAGLQAPDAGSVRAHGAALRGLHPRASLMFQDPCLLPWLTLAENLGFGLDFSHQPERDHARRGERVQAMAATLGLAAALERYPGELTDAMAQRVALARSLLRQPELLLLDAPFAALDAASRGELHGLLLAHVARRAVVLATRDVDEALRLADRIVLLGGTPAELLLEWRVAPLRQREPAALARLRAEIAQALHDAQADVEAAPDRAVA